MDIDILAVDKNFIVGGVATGAAAALYESLTNMLELKDFRFSLWLVVTAM